MRLKSGVYRIKKGCLKIKSMDDKINRNGSLNNGRCEFPDGKSPQSTRDKNQDTRQRENPMRLVNESIPPAMEMVEEDSGRTTSKNLKLF